MEKILKVKIYNKNRWDYNHSQHIKTDLINFSVYNLCEYPEDAIIGRDLFTASQYIDALNKGIELAKMGYDKIIGEDIDVDNEDFY